MIPSPTKLALLAGIVLLSGEVIRAGPTRYDQRQDGELNFRADIEDVVLVAVPPKDYIANGMTWVGANFIRHNPNRIPSRSPSKHGFVPTEKSPYKVDLGKSTIPVMKLQSPVVEEVKLFALRDADKDDQSKIIMGVVEGTSAPTTESKTVKKELKATTETVEKVTEATEKKKATATEATEKRKATATEEVKEEKKKTTEGVEEDKKKGSTLVVVGASDPESIAQHEGCGPMAYRDPSGKCVYE